MMRSSCHLFDYVSDGFQQKTIREFSTGLCSARQLKVGVF